MAAYMAMRIKKGKLNFNVVVAKYQALKAEIEAILKKENVEIGEDGWAIEPEGTV